MTNTTAAASERTPFDSIVTSVQEKLNETVSENGHVFFFLVGIPGSGKTTFTSKFMHDFPVVSYDRLVVPLLKDRVDPEAYVTDSNAEIVNRIEKQVRTYLQEDKSVIVFEEATIGLSQFRAHFLYLARLHGYKTVLVHFPIDWKLAVDRNLKRSLGMTDEGQIRLPQVIVDTIHAHQNTRFRIDTPEPIETDIAATPYLMSQLTDDELHIMNSAFFKMITIVPEDEFFYAYLQTEDYSDEIWTVWDDRFEIQQVDEDAATPIQN